MIRREFFSAFACSLGVAAFPAGVWGAQSLNEEFLAAVRTGALAKVGSMLASDPSLVYARDATGRSAFVLAHLFDRQGVIDLLAEQGFIMDAVEATLAQNWERVDEIGADNPGAFVAAHPLGGTAMHAAALAGVGRDCWRVMQYGGDPNANPLGEDGQTPVRLAIDFKDRLRAIDTLATLLGNGGEANPPQRGRSSVLHGAAATGNLVMIRLVLRKGGDPELRDEAGRTPLQVAEDLGHSEAAALLRDHGSVVRDHRTSRFAYTADGSAYAATDLSGYDPVLRNRMVGASHFNLEVATEITDRFPDLATAISYSDEAAVEAAAHIGRRPVARLLLERGAPYSLPTAGTMNDLPWARRLLEEDPLRVNERGAHDFAMMWYTAIGGDGVEMAELLLEHGADLEQEYLGTTALHVAVRRGRENLTSFLLERGADPDAVGRKFALEGETPLDHARAHDSSRLTDILIAGGATRRIATGGD